MVTDHHLTVRRLELPVAPNFPLYRIDWYRITDVSNSLFVP